MGKKCKNKSHNTTKIDTLKDKFEVAVSRNFMFVILVATVMQETLSRGITNVVLSIAASGSRWSNRIGQLLTIQPETKQSKEAVNFC